MLFSRRTYAALYLMQWKHIIASHRKEWASECSTQLQFSALYSSWYKQLLWQVCLLKSFVVFEKQFRAQKQKFCHIFSRCKNCAHEQNFDTNGTSYSRGETGSLLCLFFPPAQCLLIDINRPGVVMVTHSSTVTEWEEAGSTVFIPPPLSVHLYSLLPLIL